MKVILVLSLAVVSMLGYAEDKPPEQKNHQIQVPNDQSISGILRVNLLDVALTDANKPTLSFLYVKKDKPAIPTKDSPAILTAKNQVWQTAENTQASGTLLLFDISDAAKEIEENCWFCVTMHVVPILKWQEQGNRLKAMLKDYSMTLSNPKLAIFYVIASIILLGIFLYLLPKGHRKGFLKTSDGRWSLSMLQMALWTLAIGSMILGFGLLQSRMPDIPETLVMLMGMSATTTVVGRWQGHRKEMKESGNGKSNSVAGLLTIDINGEPAPSLAKLQLLYWTVISIVIFLVKSFDQGDLWEIPGNLVALMGVSQLGYMGRNEVQLAKTNIPEDKGAGEKASEKP